MANKIAPTSKHTAAYRTIELHAKNEILKLSITNIFCDHFGLTKGDPNDALELYNFYKAVHDYNYYLESGNEAYLKSAQVYLNVRAFEPNDELSNDQNRIDRLAQRAEFSLVESDSQYVVNYNNLPTRQGGASLNPNPSKELPPYNVSDDKRLSNLVQFIKDCKNKENPDFSKDREEFLKIRKEAYHSSAFHNIPVTGKKDGKEKKFSLGLYLNFCATQFSAAYSDEKLTEGEELSVWGYDEKTAEVSFSTNHIHSISSSAAELPDSFSIATESKTSKKNNEIAHAATSGLLNHSVIHVNKKEKGKQVAFFRSAHVARQKEPIIHIQNIFAAYDGFLRYKREDTKNTLTIIDLTSSDGKKETKNEQEVVDFFKKLMSLSGEDKIPDILKKAKKDKHNISKSKYFDLLENDESMQNIVQGYLNSWKNLNNGEIKDFKVNHIRKGYNGFDIFSSSIDRQILEGVFSPEDKPFKLNHDERTKARNVLTVKNNKIGPGETITEKDIIKALIINEYDAVRSDPNLEKNSRPYYFNALIAAYNHYNGSPCLFHCKSGKDRTEIVARLTTRLIAMKPQQLKALSNKNNEDVNKLLQAVHKGVTDDAKYLTKMNKNSNQEVTNTHSLESMLYFVLNDKLPAKIPKFIKNFLIVLAISAAVFVAAAVKILVKPFIKLFQDINKDLNFSNNILAVVKAMLNVIPGKKSNTTSPDKRINWKNIGAGILYIAAIGSFIVPLIGPAIVSLGATAAAGLFVAAATIIGPYITAGILCAAVWTFGKSCQRTYHGLTDSSSHGLIKVFMAALAVPITLIAAPFDALNYILKTAISCFSGSIYSQSNYENDPRRGPLNLYNKFIKALENTPVIGPPISTVFLAVTVIATAIIWPVVHIAGLFTSKVPPWEDIRQEAEDLKAAKIQNNRIKETNKESNAYNYTEYRSLNPNAIVGDSLDSQWASFCKHIQDNSYPKIEDGHAVIDKHPCTSWGNTINIKVSGDKTKLTQFDNETRNIIEGVSPESLKSFSDDDKIQICTMVDNLKKTIKCLVDAKVITGSDQLSEQFNLKINVKDNNELSDKITSYIKGYTEESIKNPNSEVKENISTSMKIKELVEPSAKAPEPGPELKTEESNSETTDNPSVILSAARKH